MDLLRNSIKINRIRLYSDNELSKIDEYILLKGSMDKDEAKKVLETAHKNFLNKKYSLARDLWLKCLKICVVL